MSVNKNALGGGEKAQQLGESACGKGTAHLQVTMAHTFQKASVRGTYTPLPHIPLLPEGTWHKVIINASANTVLVGREVQPSGWQFGDISIARV